MQTRLPIIKKNVGMAQPVWAPTSKPDDLGSILGTHIVGGENRLHAVL